MASVQRTKNGTQWFFVFYDKETKKYTWEPSGIEIDNSTENTSRRSKDKAIKALREFLRPEFLARVDEIVVFSPLNVEALEKITALMLNELVDALAEKGIKVSFTDAVCKHIAKECENSRSGARELRNYIRRNIEENIVNLIIDNCESTIEFIAIDYAGGIKFSSNLD